MLIFRPPKSFSNHPSNSSNHKVRIMKGKNSSENKGYAFVTFRTRDLDATAIKELNNRQLKVIGFWGRDTPQVVNEGVAAEILLRRQRLQLTGLTYSRTKVSSVISQSCAFRCRGMELNKLLSIKGEEYCNLKVVVLMKVVMVVWYELSKTLAYDVLLMTVFPL